MSDLNELAELAQQLVELRTKKEELAKEKKKVDDQLDTIEEQIINLLILSPASTVIFKGIGRITLSVQSFPRMTDQDKFFGYLRTSGHGDIIKETVHSQTLRGFWNNLKATEGKLPDPATVGLEVYTENRVSLEKQ